MQASKLQELATKKAGNIITKMIATKEGRK